MKRKWLVLVGIAAAVLAFDLWYLLGDSVSAGIETDWFEDDSEEDDYGPVAPPWHEPAAWPLPRRPAALPDAPLRMRMRAAPLVVATVTPESPATEQPTPPRLPKVSLVLWDERNPAAMVDGRLVRVGDQFEQFRIGSIEPTAVTLLHGGQRHRVPVAAGAVEDVES